MSFEANRACWFADERRVLAICVFLRSLFFIYFLVWVLWFPIPIPIWGLGFDKFDSSTNFPEPRDRRSSTMMVVPSRRAQLRLVTDTQNFLFLLRFSVFPRLCLFFGIGAAFCILHLAKSVE